MRGRNTSSVQRLSILCEEGEPGTPTVVWDTVPWLQPLLPVRVRRGWEGCPTGRGRDPDLDHPKWVYNILATVSHFFTDEKKEVPESLLRRLTCDRGSSLVKSFNVKVFNYKKGSVDHRSLDPNRSGDWKKVTVTVTSVTRPWRTFNEDLSQIRTSKSQYDINPGP